MERRHPALSAMSAGNILPLYAAPATFARSAREPQHFVTDLAQAAADSLGIVLVVEHLTLGCDEVYGPCRAHSSVRCTFITAPATAYSAPTISVARENIRSTACSVVVPRGG